MRTTNSHAPHHNYPAAPSPPQTCHKPAQTRLPSRLVKTKPLGFAQKTSQNRWNLCNRLFCTKCRFNPEFIPRLNQAANVVAKHLAKHFVFHGDIRLAPKWSRNLALIMLMVDSTFRPLVVVGKEFIAFEKRSNEASFPKITATVGLGV